MSHDYKQTARRFFEYFSAGNLDGIVRDVLDPQVIVHFPGLPGPIDLSAYYKLGQDYLAAFPGLCMSVVDQIQEDRCVVTRTRFEGTHTGPLMGIPATGRSVVIEGATVDYFNEAGLLAERHEYFDMLSLMVQLGVIPMTSQG